MSSAKSFATLLVVTLILSVASISFAADPACTPQEKSFKKYGVRIRGIYIMPDEKVDSRLSGLGLVVDDAVTPELDLEYFITKNFSTELVLALSKHDIMFDNGGINGGSVWLLPPSLYVKYHPIPTAKISPYVGFGMNVVMPFDEKLTLGGDSVPFKINSSVGWAAKVGADVRITDSVYWNIDAMYYDCRPDMNVAGTTFKLDLNPFIIGTGIGVRF
ncbi:MAG: outer membrane beta-barrel protein [Geobacteraceae bacterium]|nr:outer membrane beta-barrel protein [Geobacteraceae bacterium]